MLEFDGQCYPYFVFFFSSRRRHTRYIGDWSSDVCSSDLPHPNPSPPEYRGRGEQIPKQRANMIPTLGIVGGIGSGKSLVADEIGRASCRERVEISVVAVAVQRTMKEANRVN